MASCRAAGLFQVSDSGSVFGRTDRGGFSSFTIPAGCTLQPGLPFVPVDLFGKRRGLRQDNKRVTRNPGLSEASALRFLAEQTSDLTGL